MLKSGRQKPAQDSCHHPDHKIGVRIAKLSAGRGVRFFRVALCAGANSPHPPIRIGKGGPE
jgi:hypothetical protein